MIHQATFVSYVVIIFVLIRQAAMHGHLKMQTFHWAATLFISLLHIALLREITVQYEHLTALLALSNVSILIALCFWIWVLLLTIFVNNAALMMIIACANAFVLALTLLSPDNSNFQLENVDVLHVFISIMTYSILGIAAFISVIAYLSEYILRHPKYLKLVTLLPSLTQSDRLLSITLWAAFIGLCLTLTGGFIILEDLFEQKIVHKTVFTVICLLICATILISKHTAGLRGRPVHLSVIFASFCLMLGYLGSKFVLERLLI